VGDNDEFDWDAAPLPPHEREWRHPAEMHHEMRLRHQVESAPPPLSRRFTMVVSFISLAVSFSLLLVTVPKGLSSTSADVPAPTSSSVVPPKGSAPESATPAALHVTDGLLVVEARDARDGRQGVTVREGRTVSAVHLVTFSAHCMSVLETDTDLGSDEWFDLDREEFAYLGRAGQLHIVDSTGSRIMTRPGISMEGDDPWLPLDTDGIPVGIGTVMTADGRVVGYAMRCAHETWAVRYADLLSLVSDVRGARP
jgi:hypothetical protein